MQKKSNSIKNLTIAVILIVLLVGSVATVSAARGGEPGKPTDTPGKSAKTPPGQAKKASNSTNGPSANPPSASQSANKRGDNPAFTSASSEKVDFIAGFSCRINQSPIGGDDTFSTDSRSMITPSGNTLLKCTGDIPPELVPSSAVVDTGFECVTSLGSTTVSRKVFTPNGKVHLTCLINGQNKVDE
jgi:hypothetical protein